LRDPIVTVEWFSGELAEQRAESHDPFVGHSQGSVIVTVMPVNYFSHNEGILEPDAVRSTKPKVTRLSTRHEIKMLQVCNQPATAS
jgi:hypothetical protein